MKEHYSADLPQFSEKIQQQRKKKNLSRAALARLAGVSVTRIAEIETCKARHNRRPSHPKPETVERLALALELPLTEMWQLTCYMPYVEYSPAEIEQQRLELVALNNTAAAYAAEYAKLTPDQQREHARTLNWLLEDAIKKQSK